MKALLVSRSGRIRNCRCVQRRVIMYVRPGRTSRGKDTLEFRKPALRVARESTWVRFGQRINLGAVRPLENQPGCGSAVRQSGFEGRGFEGNGGGARTGGRCDLLIVRP